MLVAFELFILRWFFARSLLLHIHFQGQVAVLQVSSSESVEVLIFVEAVTNTYLKRSILRGGTLLLEAIVYITDNAIAVIQRRVARNIPVVPFVQNCFHLSKLFFIELIYVC